MKCKYCGENVIVAAGTPVTVWATKGGQ